MTDLFEFCRRFFGSHFDLEFLISEFRLKILEMTFCRPAIKYTRICLQMETNSKGPMSTQ